jgi:hypothetical protein
MHLLDLARSGEALFKVRGKFLKYVILAGAVVAYFHGSAGPFASAIANQAWFWLSFGVALAGALSVSALAWLGEAQVSVLAATLYQARRREGDVPVQRGRIIRPRPARIRTEPIGRESDLVLCLGGGHAGVSDKPWPASFYRYLRRY